MITIHIPGALRSLCSGRGEVLLNANGDTVLDALQALWIAYPGLRDRVMTEQGQIREHINIFVGNEHIRYTGGLATPISAGSDIFIVPAISGGVKQKTMPKSGRNKLPSPLSGADPFAIKPRKTVPHAFVLDALAPLSPRTNPMFGCLAIYVGERIVLILRDKRDKPADNGVWLATTQEHHSSLRREFPHMRSIAVLGKKVTGWQLLPADAPDFEETALRACELVLAGDPRIGKVPGAKRSRARKEKSPQAAKPVSKP